MYIKEYEFRYGDLNRRGNIKISTVLDILQEAAILHSSAVGYDSDKLAEMKIAWLLEGWRVRFDIPLHNRSKVAVKTGIMTIKSCESNRGYEVWQDGERKVIATADWFTMNTEKRRITRIPQECIDAFDRVDEPDNGLLFERFKPEEEISAVDTRTVERRDIDTNNHMNNVKSVEILLDYLPDDFAVKEMAVRYRKELVFGETVTVCRKETGNGFILELKNHSGDACVMMNVKGE